MDGGGGRGAPLPSLCIHPPRDLVKGGKGNWRSGLKDLIKWISWGRFYLNAGILSGGLLPENAGTPDEEVILIESRKGELCVAAIASIEIGWSLLRGLGAPAEIMLAGPNPIPTDFDPERLDQDTGKHEMQGMLSSGPWERREERKTTGGRTTLQRERARVLAPNGTDLSANGHEVESR